MKNCFLLLINRNMRCIEIAWQKNGFRKKQPINRNMRCIEIDEDRAEAEGIGRLIET